MRIFLLYGISSQGAALIQAILKDVTDFISRFNLYVIHFILNHVIDYINLLYSHYYVLLISAVTDRLTFPVSQPIQA